MLRQAGLRAEEIAHVKDNVERFGLEKAASELSDSLVRKVTIAGTPDQVVEGLRQILGSGLKLPIVWGIIGPNRGHLLSLIATKVMPKVVQENLRYVCHTHTLAATFENLFAFGSFQISHKTIFMLP